MQLDVFRIRNLKRIYRWCADPVDCAYYYDSESKLRSLCLYVERNIDCEAQWLFCFELLCNSDGIYIMKVHRNDDEYVHILGQSSDHDVRMTFVELIIDSTVMSLQWRKMNPLLAIEHMQHERELEIILSRFVDRFLCQISDTQHSFKRSIV
jgi:hypothetical protein